MELARHLPGELVQLMFRRGVLFRRQAGKDIVVGKALGEFLDQSALPDPSAASDDDEGCGPFLGGLDQAFEFRLSANETGHGSPWK